MIIALLGGRLVGHGRPCLITAELGLNHGGSIDTALEMVRSAAASGADAVKVQCFKADSFTTSAATYKGERQLDMFRRYELGTVAFSAIADECHKHGLLFFGTPDSLVNARILVAFGAKVIKVGSDDIVHLPLLRELAKIGLPMILSTGMADNQELNAALYAVRGVPVVLLHCVSSYPTPTRDVNLNRMLTLRAWDRLVGYSDHTDGVDAAIGAVWLGACLVEKHFTLDRKSLGPDHAFSADPSQFAEMALRIRAAEMMMGTGAISPGEDERAMRVTARRSIVAARAIATGEVFTPPMLAYKRPGDGLQPAVADTILGKRAVRAVAADEQIREGDWA